MRDHTKLDAFHAADALAVAVYAATRGFPAQERFGLALQLRRAAVSAVANLVEGCARETSAELARFIGIAYASAREAQYEIHLAARLGYVTGEIRTQLLDQASLAARQLERLGRRARSFRSSDGRRSRS